jgi:hypothetical protein
MLPQNASQLKPPSASSVEWLLPQVQPHLESIVQSLHQAALDGTAAHEVERSLFHQLLRLGHLLFGSFLTLVGPGDLGEAVPLENGHPLLQRLEEQHIRRLLTVFGPFELSRYVYAPREGQKIELAPTDQRLQLPESEVSYLLQEWDQLLGVEHAFGKVRDTLQTILRLKQSVDTLEHTNQQMAEASPAFREAQPPIDPAKDGELLVVTEDNKGIPMVRPVEEKPVGAHRKKGEKANKKQMACIGSVYSVDPNVRTAEELVAILFRDADRPKNQPPEAKQKRYWAELTRLINGKVVRGQDLVFEHLRDEIEQRRLPGQTLVHLSDGQKSLETDRQEYLPVDAATVDILDLMHVIPRLWEAAHVFHTEGSDEASDFVRARLLRVLRGEISGVISGLRRMATLQKLRGAKRQRLAKACAFLEKNKHRMRYDEYLKAGYPIATGVIEGACRHVIKDRMERAGMRWKVPGAQAMLHLRTIHANGDWDAFQKFRCEYETKRLYPHTRAVQGVDWPFSQAN